MNQQVTPPVQAMGENTKLAVRQWQALCKELAKLKAEEMAMRKKLCETFVPQPVEGTNNIQGDGFVVKVVHKLTRNIDEAALDAVMMELPEPYRVLGVLINYKPNLVMSGYKALPEEYKKIFEQALVIKDAAPALEIELAEEPAPAKKTSAQKPKSKKK